MYNANQQQQQHQEPAQNSGSAMGGESGESGVLMVRDKSGEYQVASNDLIIEAARKAIEFKYQRGKIFVRPNDSREFFVAKLGGFEHEVFAVAFLDNQHQLIEYKEMFHGSICSAEIHPREVVKEALRLNAASVLLSHNHLSGNPEPSEADRNITKKLKDALALLDVRVLDHIVVGGTRTVSFAESGIF